MSCISKLLRKRCLFREWKVSGMSSWIMDLDAYGFSAITAYLIQSSYILMEICMKKRINSVKTRLNALHKCKTTKILYSLYTNSGISRKLKILEESHKIYQRNLHSTGFINIFKFLFLFKETKSHNCIGWVLDVD